jgi:hypothetical protein
MFISGNSLEYDKMHVRSVGVFARLKASRARARGDHLTWLRDESSRTASATAADQPAAPPPAARPAVPVATVPRQLEGPDHVPHQR